MDSSVRAPRLLPDPSTDGVDDRGSLAQLVRDFDWASTDLGHPSTWSTSLRIIVRFVLAQRVPMLLWWGPDYIQIYNDAYVPILGAKHPAQALGRPFRECWHEVFHVLGPLVDVPFSGGPATWMEDIELVVRRHGFAEESHFTIAYSPVPDDEALRGIGGVLATVVEITHKVIGERRLTILSELGSRVAEAKTAEDACQQAMQILAKHPKDVPFARLYLFDGATGRLQPAGSTGFPDGTGDHSEIDLESPQGELAGLLSRALHTGAMQMCSGLSAVMPAVPPGPWPEAPDRLAVVPIKSNLANHCAGVLVAGISACIRPDALYVSFLELVASQIATAVANARAYEEERRRAEALAQIDRAKTTFFSNVSHEFRTPLTLMLGPLADALAEEMPAPLRLQLEVAHRNAQRLLKLVNSLLDFARIEAGRMQAVYEPVDLAAHTAELASVFRSAIEKAGMRLVVRCEPTPVPVFVDRDMWEKIVLNLLSNAFKYTLEGEIRVLLSTAGGHALLSVEDTGVGIAEDELHKVFLRFHRVEGVRGRTQEGSGIGLALVQELVKLHGGTVEVQSTAGRGSRFTVSVPLGRSHLPDDRIGAGRTLSSTALAAQVYVDEALRWLPQGSVSGVAPDSLAPRTGQTSARARIVVADDNADMRDYVARLLSMHDVTAVGDGEQALAAARERVPDLILTDVMMPNLDGFGLLKALREDAVTSAIPVIMLSARAGEEAGVEGRSAGADDYLVKPFSARELQSRVEAQLALRRARNEALGRERALRAEAETLNTVAEQLAGELDLHALVQKVTDAATQLTGAKFGAFFYNVVNDKGEAYQLFTLSGAHRSQFEEFGMPRNTPIFAPTFSGEAPVRLDDVTRDRRYGTMSPHHGQPKGHLPVTSYLAVPVKTRAGEVLGGLFFGHPDPAVFTEHSERLAVGVAALAAVAMDNARLYQAARDSDRRKDEFLATLAHELRNPLAPLRNAVEILQRLPLEREALDPVCRMMERQLGHIVRLIDDLLDLSRISLGKVTLQKAPVEVAKALQGAIETSRPILEARNHRLSVSTPPDSAWIDADATRLAQVFANLLNNAAKFTPPGGLIEVRVDRRQDGVEVSVKDNGSGIPRAMLERIFDMFSQLDDPIQKTQSGLGIGLTLVRQLVELHGGTVRAESDGLGKGATFCVRLPMLTRVSPPASAGDQRPQVGSRLRVLIADDNVDAAFTLDAMLTLDGHEVRTVHAGAEAVREAATFRPQVVLLDLGMPDMDGFEVCRRIRAEQPRDARMLIAALTGWGQDDHQLRARQAGFDRHLVKPAEPELIQALLAAAVGDENPAAGAR